MEIAFNVIRLNALNEDIHFRAFVFVPLGYILGRTVSFCNKVGN